MKIKLIGGNFLLLILFSVNYLFSVLLLFSVLVVVALLKGRSLFSIIRQKLFSRKNNIQVVIEISTRRPNISIVRKMVGLSPQATKETPRNRTIIIVNPKSAIIHRFLVRSRINFLDSVSIQREITKR